MPSMQSQLISKAEHRNRKNTVHRNLSMLTVPHERIVQIVPYGLITFQLSKDIQEHMLNDIISEGVIPAASTIITHIT